MSIGDCDVDDILCQVETLRHLRGLKKEMGSEAFKTKYPELIGIEEKLATEIQAQKGNLKEALESCGSGIEDYIPEDVVFDDS